MKKICFLLMLMLFCLHLCPVVAGGAHEEEEHEEVHDDEHEGDGLSFCFKDSLFGDGEVGCKYQCYCI